MKFNSLLFRRKKKIFRRCWNESHYLTYDCERNEFIEHCGEVVKVWYWSDFESALKELSADDWRYIE